MFLISITILLIFVCNGLIDNIPALVQTMAQCQLGNKPLSELMVVSLLAHICVARPQWANGRRNFRQRLMCLFHIQDIKKIPRYRGFACEMGLIPGQVAQQHDLIVQRSSSEFPAATTGKHNRFKLRAQMSIFHNVECIILLNKKPRILSLVTKRATIIHTFPIYNRTIKPHFFGHYSNHQEGITWFRIHRAKPECNINPTIPVLTCIRLSEQKTTIVSRHYQAHEDLSRVRHDKTVCTEIRQNI